MKRILPFLSILSIAAMVFTSCEKESTVKSSEVEDINELVVPTGFNWQTSRDVSFSIAVNDTRFGDAIHVVSVYDADPAKGGQLLSRGSATLVSPFNTKIYLPAVITEVYIEKAAPDGSRVSQIVAVTGTYVSVEAGSKDMRTASALRSDNKLMALQAAAVVALETSPDCNTGCTRVAQANETISTNSGETVCVQASNITVNFQNLNGGTVRICGKNVNVGWGSVGSNTTIIVTSGASVTFNHINFDRTSNLKNFGTITVNGNLKVNGNFLNQGNISISGDFTGESGSGSNSGVITVGSNFNSEPPFVNSGTLTVNGFFNSNNVANFTNSGDLSVKYNMTITGTFVNSGRIVHSSGEIQLNNAPQVTNSGTITANSSKMLVSGTLTNSGSVTVANLQNNGNGTIVNSCKLIVLNLLDNDNIINNYSYIKVGETLQSDNKITLYNAAMFEIKNIGTLDGTIEGTGSRSLVKVTGTTGPKQDRTQRIVGQLVYCSQETIPAAFFSNGAVQGCDLYIASTSCNPGNGTAPEPVKTDTDGDGVIDDLDAFPKDPARAFIQEQANYKSGGSTVSFEDKWPYKGDYDLNDIVLNYKYQIVTNARNRVVDIKADYKLLATGGSYQNGAGIQFNIPAANAQAITGAELESGHDSLVVILFKNSRHEQADWNTEPSKLADAKEYKVSLTLNNGPELKNFGIGNYNVFIWNGSNGFGRGYETHLPGRVPTKKANTDLFGTADDRSNVAQTYTTTGGLPWALEIPAADFAYPVEKADITKAYLKFAEWAQSGGKNVTDWYSNTGSGYRNATNIFKR